MNTVGPYHNRQETYKYFSLPFCVGTKKTISHYHETLGEALQGVELEFSGLDIKFKGIQKATPTGSCTFLIKSHIISHYLISIVWVGVVNIFLTSMRLDPKAAYTCISSCSVLCHTNTNTLCFVLTDEVMQTTYCEIELDKAKRDAFVYAIKNHYWYQMYIDDLPIWGEWSCYTACCDLSCNLVTRIQSHAPEAVEKKASKCSFRTFYFSGLICCLTLVFIASSLTITKVIYGKA